MARARLQDPVDTIFRYDGSSDRDYNITRSELGHMFYNNLDNLGYYDITGTVQSGNGVSDTDFIDGASGDTVSFSNLQSHIYWLGEEDAAGPQTYYDKSRSVFSWAVRAGRYPSRRVTGPGFVWPSGGQGANSAK